MSRLTAAGMSRVRRSIASGDTTMSPVQPSSVRRVFANGRFAALARGSYLTAADIYTKMGTRPNEAFARLRAAEQLSAAGRREEADQQLQPALAFWRSVDAKHFVREAEALSRNGVANDAALASLHREDSRLGQCSGMTLGRRRSRVCSLQGERTQRVACVARLWLGGDRVRLGVSGAIHVRARPSRSDSADRPPCASQPNARLRRWSCERPTVRASPAAGQELSTNAARAVSTDLGR